MVIVFGFCGQIQTIQRKNTRRHIHQGFQGISENCVGIGEQPCPKFQCRKQHRNTEQQSLYAKIIFDAKIFTAIIN